MAKLPPRPNNDVFASVVSEIKKYTGTDPLLPWIQGIKKMRNSLPPQILKEKLPRFLQKCALTFQADPRYRNDLRYVRVWIRLMDFVDDPQSLLKTMERNCIGTKLALFYEAYALYFVKLKKFEEADNMYHLGVQNLAEPAGELQKSYEQFLHLMEQYKKKRTRHQDQRAALAARSNGCCESENEKLKQDSGKVKSRSIASIIKETSNHNDKEAKEVNVEPDTEKSVCNDETVVFKFVDTAIVGKSEAEDACHHGLVDPTINMKEAMNAINDMFREPLELEALHRKKSHKDQSKTTDKRASGGFNVFLDEDLNNGMSSSENNIENCAPPSSSVLLHSMKSAASRNHQPDTHSPPQETFKIFLDDDEYDNEGSDGKNGNTHQNAFVFPRSNDSLSNGSDDTDALSSPGVKFREDTVVGRFVGSAIQDDPAVENACHHGLVDPTINLKEAMDAINGMFGKPLDFVKANRSKGPGKVAHEKIGSGGFSILADEDLKTSSHSSSKLGSDFDLFEPTINTKKALDDINEMFGMPLDI